MNVNDALHNLMGVSGVAQAAPVSEVTRTQSVASSEPNAQADRANLSTAASLASQAMALPDVRMDKVAAVQQALANGTYQVSAADVADKLIDSMRGR